MSSSPAPSLPTPVWFTGAHLYSGEEEAPANHALLDVTPEKARRLLALRDKVAEPEMVDLEVTNLTARVALVTFLDRDDFDPDEVLPEDCREETYLERPPTGNFAVRLYGEPDVAVSERGFSAAGLVKHSSDALTADGPGWDDLEVIADLDRIAEAEPGHFMKKAQELREQAQMDPWFQWLLKKRVLDGRVEGLEAIAGELEAARLALLQDENRELRQLAVMSIGKSQARQAQSQKTTPTRKAR